MSLRPPRVATASRDPSPRRAPRRGAARSRSLRFAEGARLLHEQKNLKARAQAPSSGKQAHAVIRVLPAVAERALRELRSILYRDLLKARALVQGLVVEVKIVPVNLGRSDAHLEAELTGNLAGAVRLASGETFVVAGEDLPNISPA